MAAYLLRRLLLIIPTLFGVLLINFAIVQFVPGGPAEQLLSQLTNKENRLSGGPQGAPSTPSRWRRSRPSTASTSRRSSAIWQMLKQFARFDLGKSFFQHRKDVWQLIKEKLPVSISLGLWTFFLTYLIAVPLGIAKAVRAGTRFDFLTTLLVLVGYAIPGFVLGVVLLVIFGGGTLQWFPLRGLTSPNWESLSWGARIVDYLWHITLADHGDGAGQFRDHRDAHQERLPRRNPQAVRADRACQGPGRAPGALEARVPQRADPAHHRLPGGLYRRLLHRARC